MSQETMNRLVKALKQGTGLKDDFIYYMPFEDYKNLPDPFREPHSPSRKFKKGSPLSQSRKAGRIISTGIFTAGCSRRQRISIPDMAVVMIHGGAANEYEFIFTPDGPEEYPDLTKPIPPKRASAWRSISLRSVFPCWPSRCPAITAANHGHPSRNGARNSLSARPQAIRSLRTGLAVYTFRMCTEAIKALVEKNLNESIFMWGHSTGGEYFYLMEQYGLKNKLIGGLGFGTGMPAWVRKEWDLACAEKIARRARRAVSQPYRLEPPLAEGLRRKAVTSDRISPGATPERWFELENHRRPQFKPFLQDIEHSAHDVLLPEIKKISGLPDDELFITYKSDLKRLRGKKLLHIVGEYDKGHWIEGGEKGLEFRREVYAFKRFKPFAKDVALDRRAESHPLRPRGKLQRAVGQYHGHGIQGIFLRAE